MSSFGEFYVFSDGALRPLNDTLSETLTVADSFLIQEGRVRQINRHFERFEKSIASPEVKATLPEFFSAVLAELPRSGSWFPRLEYREHQPESERLVLRLREAPERTATLSLWSSDEPDPRKQAGVKGPDLSVCQRLRRAANLHGADEAVILSQDGFIADGALSSIMWWESETLCAPDDTTDWLPSITRQLVFELAREAGYQTLEKRAKPSDLENCEVWSLSSLQGIRYVTAWGDLKLGESRHASSFRKRLALLASSIDNVSWAA